MQIRSTLSPSTAADSGAYDSLQVTTKKVFLASNDLLTYQMNALVNQCSSPSGCAGTWWMQGIVSIERGGAIPNWQALGLSASGWYVYQSHLEFVVDAYSTNTEIPPSCVIGYSYGSLTQIPSYVNIDQVGYFVKETVTLSPVSSSPYVNLSLIVGYGSTQVYSRTFSCSTSSVASLDPDATPVYNFYQVEGVIVGHSAGIGPYETLNPLNTAGIFTATLSLSSTKNDLSYQGGVQSQTGEASNLIQTYTSKSCPATGGAGYTCTVNFSEGTTNNAGLYQVCFEAVGNQTDITFDASWTSNGATVTWNSSWKYGYCIYYEESPDNPDSLAPGTVLSIEAVSSSSFDQWQASPSGTIGSIPIANAGSSSTTATILGSGTITAYFYTYTLTLSIDPSACGAQSDSITISDSQGGYATLTGSGLIVGIPYPAGTTVTITEVPTAGCTSSGWEGSGQGYYTGPSASYTLTMTGSMTEIAEFAQASGGGGGGGGCGVSVPVGQSAISNSNWVGAMFAGCQLHCIC